MASAKPDQFRLDDSKIRRGDIALLLNTRGRPEKLVEVFDSLRQTTVQKDSVSLWLLVDDDDNLTRSAIDAGKFPDPGFRGWRERHCPPTRDPRRRRRRGSRR